MCGGPGGTLQKMQREARGSWWSLGRARPQSGKILASRVARDNGRWSYPIGGARADRPQQASLVCSEWRGGIARGLTLPCRPPTWTCSSSSSPHPCGADPERRSWRSHAAEQKNLPCVKGPWRPFHGQCSAGDGRGQQEGPPCA
ncbi:hypothetical protein NDU88_001790 [Pleurodeles waltl]|uniref:Uncharacterized protein n=1 Tax=Pleurodeles waltl TaxID=8319 RepID=A0AAV7W236_PLEWA|nr:hypothetical protein NDU88_001790 [Pleurodeles waltl]